MCDTPCECHAHAGSRDARPDPPRHVLTTQPQPRCECVEPCHTRPRPTAAAAQDGLATSMIAANAARAHSGQLCPAWRRLYRRSCGTAAVLQSAVCSAHVMACCGGYGCDACTAARDRRFARRRAHSTASACCPRPLGCRSMRLTSSARRIFSSMAVSESADRTVLQPCPAIGRSSCKLWKAAALPVDVAKWYSTLHTPASAVHLREKLLHLKSLE